MDDGVTISHIFLLCCSDSDRQKYRATKHTLHHQPRFKFSTYIFFFSHRGPGSGYALPPPPFIQHITPEHRLTSKLQTQKHILKMQISSTKAKLGCKWYSFAADSHSDFTHTKLKSQNIMFCF